jgi:hypothetical protein
LKSNLLSFFTALRKIDFSKWSILFVLAFVIIYAIEFEFYKRQDRIIASDVIHYYAYLPAAVIYKDLSLDFVYEDPGHFSKMFWPVKAPNGKHAFMVTMGMSILYAPAFFLTHAIVSISGGDTSGFSEPYRLGLVIMGWVYLFLALLMLRKVLLRYFSKNATALSLIMVVIGTNLFHYATAETTMSHQYSFFLFSAFLLLTIQWHEKPRLSKAILLGFVGALITLVRPSNVLIGLIFVFWETGSFSGIAEKLRIFRKHYRSVILIVISAIIVWIPQFVYWKVYTGSWFFLGYGDNGASFFFDNPQIINNLFSYRKGWLVYTPLMVFAFVGITVLWKQKRGIAVPIVIYTLFNVYLVSSWWSWWYGGGFGMRAYVETYAIYALGFAAFVDWVLKSKLLVRIPILLLVFALVGFSYFQTRQYYWGAIHYVGMTKEAYWHQFLKLKPYGDYYKKLTIPDMDKARKGIYVFEPVE